MTKRQRTLSEVDLQTALIFGEVGRDFMKETRCLVFALSQASKDAVSSAMDKLAIRVWPLGTMVDRGVNPVLIDSEARIAVLEVEYDLMKYYSKRGVQARHSEVVDLIERSLSILPEKVGIDLTELVLQLTALRNRGFAVSDDVGGWVSNSNKTISIKLFYTFDENQIELGVSVKRKGGRVITKQVFASFAPTKMAILYELGKLEFQDVDSVVYSPRSHFGGIAFTVE